MPTKVHLVQAMVFPVVMYGCELDHKEGWVPKNWCFWIMVLEKTLESPLDCRRSNKSILKEISPEYSLGGLMLKLKLQFWLWPRDAKGWLIKEDLDGRKDWRQEEKGTTDGWHHRLNGHAFEQAPGDGEGQGSLACWSPRGHKDSDMTEWLSSNACAAARPLSSSSLQRRDGGGAGPDTQKMPILLLGLSCWHSCCWKLLKIIWEGDTVT